MRPIAFLGLALLLGGCADTVGNPFDGFGTFLGDTQLFRSNPNKPEGSEETLQRVQGGESAVAPGPLLPEQGDVWPGKLKPIPTTQDLQNLNSIPNYPGPEVSPTPPPNLFPNSPPAPGAGSLLTPNGPVSTYQGGNGVTTFTEPGRGSGTVVTNPNGTRTLVGPNGGVQTVPGPQ